MPCSTGRATQKYTSGTTASGSATLQDITENGNTTTLSIETGSFFIGDGSQLTNLPASSYGTLEQVALTGNTVSHTVYFQNTLTSIEASANVVVVGNVTAEKFYGNGIFLTGVALLSNVVDLETSNTAIWSNLASNVSKISVLQTAVSNLYSSNAALHTDLASNVSKITTLETSTIISNSAGITSSFTVGDILYASADDTLAKLSIGANVTTGDVLTVTSAGSKSLAWQSPSVGGGGGNLQQVTSNGSTTDVYVEFLNELTSFRAHGNVVVDSNVTAVTFHGNGAQLTGIVVPADLTDLQTAVSNLYLSNAALHTDLISNVSKISVLQTAVSNLYISNAALRTDLTSNASRVQILEDSGGGTVANYTTDGTNTGISNTNPQHTLDIGSNVRVSDVADDVVVVLGNVGVSGTLTASDSMFTQSVFCTTLFTKNTIIIAERPVRKVYF
jgi:hypothetical protein